MERGLMWLPLLAVFIGLAWAGWNEYQKVQAYEAWARQFEHSKYDIRAMLGQTGSQLVWGKPTRQGPIELQSLALDAVSNLAVQVKGKMIDPQAPPQTTGNAELRFELRDGASQIIPFTDLTLALQWFEALHQRLQALKSTSN